MGRFTKEQQVVIVETFAKFEAISVESESYFVSGFDKSCIYGNTPETIL